MNYLGFLCIFVALGVCVEGRFLSNQIGNSLPALNYGTHLSAINNINNPAFLTSNSRKNPRKFRRASSKIDDEMNEIIQARSTRTIQSDFRGGSTAAAQVARTMTARRMESFK